MPFCDKKARKVAHIKVKMAQKYSQKYEEGCPKFTLEGGRGGGVLVLGKVYQKNSYLFFKSTSFSSIFHLL